MMAFGITIEKHPVLKLRTLPSSQRNFDRGTLDSHSVCFKFK